MLHQFSRNELAVGTEGLNKLKNTTVAILGVGGVGSFAAEACARSGVGRIILVDKDNVDITNINRQLVAYLSTVGKSKSAVMKERIADISKTHTDPLAKVIRTKLRKEGIKKGVTVVFSDESPIVIRPDVAEYVGKPEAEIRKAKMPPSSNAFAPSTAGLIAASWVVNKILADIKINRVQG